MCMLHGGTILQVEAIPTWLFLKSLSLNPTARSMARLAARSGFSVMFDDQALGPADVFFVGIAHSRLTLFVRVEAVEPQKTGHIPPVASGTIKTGKTFRDISHLAGTHCL